MKLEESFVWAVSVFMVSYFVYEALRDPPDPVFPRFYGSGRTGRTEVNKIRQNSHQPRFDFNRQYNRQQASNERFRNQMDDDQRRFVREEAEFQVRFAAIEAERDEGERYEAASRELDAGLGQEMTGDGDYTDEYKKARKQLDDAYMGTTPVRRRYGPPYGPIVMWPPPPTVEEVGFNRWFKKHYPEHGKEPGYKP